MSEINSRPQSQLQPEEQRTHDYEDRLVILENWKESMQVGILERLTPQVAAKFNLNLRMHLPKVADLMHDYDLLKEKFVQKKAEDAILFQGNEESLDGVNSAVSSLNFKCNSL